MIIPVGKTFLVLPHHHNTVSSTSGAELNLPAKIVIFTILFPLFVAISIMLIDTIRNMLNYNNCAEDYVAVCILFALWMCALVLVVGIWLV